MLEAATFLRRFRYLILLTWLVPPVIGLSFILYIRVLTWEQMEVILFRPIVPLYSLGALGLALLYFNHYIKPVHRWLTSRSPDAVAPALHCMRYFPLFYWGAFLVYLALAPSYTDYVARPVDWFRIQLIALIVSIIVGLPIFFRLLDLFGRALGDIALKRAQVTIKTKIFLIGSLVPLLIDTVLVQYYWTRTGFFSHETFLVWLSLELVAIAGSLIFVGSIGQSMEPLRKMLDDAPGAAVDTVDTAVLRAASTDELGVLTCGYRELLRELAIRNEVLSLNNQILHTMEKIREMPRLIDAIVELCRVSIGDDRAFLLLHDDRSNELTGVAQTGCAYSAHGHFRISMQETSLAVWILKNHSAIAIDNVENDPRVCCQMRESLRITSVLGAPLRYEGRPIGVLLTIKHDRRQDYTDRERLLIESLANETAIAITTARLDGERRAAELALRDSHAMLERKISERTADLETSNRELESFSYSVSHDLRAPLRAIDGYSEALLHDYPDSLDENGRYYLDRIRGNARHMAHLIDDLLNLARIGRAELHYEAIDIRAMVLELVGQFRERQPERNIDFDVQVDGAINGDRPLLRIALENLLANAWKYSRQRDVARIRLTSRRDEDSMMYSISDNGAGFDMSYANKLFRPFERLHSAEEFDGTGIGLATVARIVHRHGGRIWADAEVDRGATFHFTLPVK
jgi:signal transduction histidine kinase